MSPNASSFTPQALDVCRWVAQQGVPVHLVGGSVRDLLLQRVIHDIDLVVPLGQGLALAQRLADSLHGAYYPLDETRDVGRVVFISASGERLVVDIAAYRAADLTADLLGRDFTINALAVSLAGSEAKAILDPQSSLFALQSSLLDLVGGLDDLKAGVIRALSERSIPDDYLRALRAVRFSQMLGFHLEESTRQWIRQAAFGLVLVSPERVRDELAKIMRARGAEAALRTMGDLGLWPHTLPEMSALQGVSQSPPHVYDVYEHTLAAVGFTEWVLDLVEETDDGRRGTDDGVVSGITAKTLQPFLVDLRQQLSQPLSGMGTRRELLKWVALCHDWGKPATRSLDPDGRIRYYTHEAVSAEMTMMAAQRLHFSTDEMRLLAGAVRAHMRPGLLAPHPSARALYRFWRQTGEAGVEATLVTLADRRATFGPTLDMPEWLSMLPTLALLLQAYFDPARRPQSIAPLLRGDELMRVFDLSPGPQIGALLETLREAQAVGEVTDREQALALVARTLGRAEDGRRRMKVKRNP